MTSTAVPITIDDEIEDAVRELGLAFNGVDEDTLSFVPLEGVNIGDEGEGSAKLDAVFEALSHRGLLDKLPPNVNAIRIDPI